MRKREVQIVKEREREVEESYKVIGELEIGKLDSERKDEQKGRGERGGEEWGRGRREAKVIAGSVTRAAPTGRGG